MSGGGAERQLSIVAPLLVEYGWCVHVALIKGGPNELRLVSANITMHYIPYSSNYDPRILWYLYRVVQQVRPDLIHTWLPMMDILGGFISIFSSIPWIMSERSSAIANSRGIKMKIRKLMAPRARGIIANSIHAIKYWEGLVGSQTMFIHIPNAVVSNVNLCEEEKNKICFKSPYFLCVGRLVDSKNVKSLLEAFYRLGLEKEFPVQLVICGEGECLKELEDTAFRLGISDKCFFMGYVHNISNLMVHAAGLISPSFYEGMPNVALEGAKSKCPLLLSDIVAHKELFNSDSCYYFDPYNIDDIVKAIECCMRDDLQQEKINQAEIAVGNMDPYKIARMYHDNYMKIVG